METLKYCKIRNVKSPTRAHETDAGIDFFVPEDLTVGEMKEKFALTGHDLNLIVDNELNDPNDTAKIKSFILEPGQSILIPSGIKVKVPDGYMLQFHNKSGIASKRGLLVGANTVDIGYEGECHLNLHNVSCYNQTISAGDKIVQGIMIPVGFHVPEECSDETELYGNEKSARGTGGFGSTGTK